MINQAGLADGAKVVLEKPFGTDLETRPEAERHRPPGLRRGPDLPDRPLPRQGGGAQHPRAAVRQRALRADLEPQPHRPRADRGPRGARARAASLVLRADGRLPRHGRHAPVPGARVRGHGAADGADAVRDQPREGQGLPLAVPARSERRRPRAVRGLSLGARGRPGLADRDDGRAALLRRQLALVGCPVLPAHRKAPGRGCPDHLDRLPGAAEEHVPATRPGSATTAPTTSPSTSTRPRASRSPSTASAPGRGWCSRSSACSSRSPRWGTRPACSRPTSG